MKRSVPLPLLPVIVDCFDSLQSDTVKVEEQEEGTKDAHCK